MCTNASDLIRKVWCTFLLSLQEVYRWGVGWMMRRRICHSPSRNCGELPLGVSNTKTESHRSQPDRPSPPSPPPCPRRRATATTASTRCPAAYNGSLAYRFTVRRGWACWRLCGLVALETCGLTSDYKQFILSLGFLVGGAVWGDPNLGAWDKQNAI